jgi:DNA-binding beta-propeller fold protein YncE
MKAPLTAMLAAAFAFGCLAAPAAATAGEREREVLYVGNNWDGSADIVDPRTFERLRRIDIVPDRAERMQEILADPVRTGFFLGIRELVGEGNDQFVDDMFSSRDGRFVYVSRPSFADVVAIDLRSGEIAWRAPVDGYRADHMAISPDGRRLLVSASTANVVHEIDTRTGRRSGSFPSGDQPHENNYSKDGRRIFHASIGAVYTPLDQPALDSSKGERVFQVVDARNLKVLRRVEIGPRVAAAGRSGYSSAVRPMALSPSERYVYMQLSFYHGFVEYDIRRDRVTRFYDLPLSESSEGVPREAYLLDSAHHGLSINPGGTKLCAAGTMSDYAAIVSRRSGRHKIIPVGPKPYWSTNSGDGRYCFVSVSGADEVSVISYKREREVARFEVGDHPQRMRMGTIRRNLVD